MKNKYPWRESLLIILLLWLNAGMQYINIKPTYVRFISKSRLVRFIMIFIASYVYFSIEFKEELQYSIVIKLIASFIISIIFDVFISSDAIYLESKATGQI